MVWITSSMFAPGGCRGDGGASTGGTDCMPVPCRSPPRTRATPSRPMPVSACTLDGPAPVSEGVSQRFLFSASFLLSFVAARMSASSNPSSCGRCGPAAFRLSPDAGRMRPALCCGRPAAGVDAAAAARSGAAARADPAAAARADPAAAATPCTSPPRPALLILSLAFQICGHVVCGVLDLAASTLIIAIFQGGNWSSTSTFTPPSPLPSPSSVK